MMREACTPTPIECHAFCLVMLIRLKLVPRSHPVPHLTRLPATLLELRLTGIPNNLIAYPDNDD